MSISNSSIELNEYHKLFYILIVYLCLVFLRSKMNMIIAIIVPWICSHARKISKDIQPILSSYVECVALMSRVKERV